MARIKEQLQKKRCRGEDRKHAEQLRQEHLAKIPKVFSAEACGQGSADGGGRKGFEMRQMCLERLRLRSPALPDALLVEWHDIRDWYAKAVAKNEKGRSGSVFLTRINLVIKCLGKHFLPGADAPASASKASAPSSASASASAPSVAPSTSSAQDPVAFTKFVQQLRSEKPKAATYAVI